MSDTAMLLSIMAIVAWCAGFSFARKQCRLPPNVQIVDKNGRVIAETDERGNTGWLIP